MRRGAHEGEGERQETHFFFLLRSEKMKRGEKKGRSRRKHSRKASSWRLEGDAKRAKEREKSAEPAPGGWARGITRERERERRQRRDKWDMQILKFLDEGVCVCVCRGREGQRE